MRCLLTSVSHPSSVVRAVVISRKLSKMTYSFCRTLLGSWHRWLCCCIQILPRRPPGEMFRFQVQNVCIWPPVRLGVSLQTTAVVNRLWPAAGVVSCCQPSATLGVCCSQSSSFVLMTPKSNRRRASFYSKWKNSCFIHDCFVAYT